MFHHCIFEGVNFEVTKDLENNPLFSTSASKMPQVMVVARNFMDMVAALPAGKLDMLYDSAFICEAVLRSRIYNIFVVHY